MKILFKQKKEQANVAFSQNFISNCYFKELSAASDHGIMNVRAHHHTDYEVHIILEGWQIYESCGQSVTVEKGDFMIFPPSVRHKSLKNSDNLRKYSIVFKSELFEKDKAFYGKISEEVQRALDFIVGECARPTVFSPQLCVNRIFETVLLLFRLCGVKELPYEKISESSDERIVLAKKYISDNIEQPISVRDISGYCYLSEKQMSRLFIKNEGVSPAKYIMRARMEKICELIIEDELTFKEISLRFGYVNECYFNTAFKKYSGMSPGQYRKMYKK